MFPIAAPGATKSFCMSTTIMAVFFGLITSTCISSPQLRLLSVGVYSTKLEMDAQNERPKHLQREIGLWSLAALMLNTMDAAVVIEMR